MLRQWIACNNARAGCSFSPVVGLRGCGVAPQPASGETVAEFEISLPTKEGRAEFLSTVRNAAKFEGSHLGAATDGREGPLRRRAAAYRDKAAALTFMKKTMKRHHRVEMITTACDPTKRR